MQGWIPRPLIIAAIVLVSVVELVFRVPDLCKRQRTPTFRHGLGLSRLRAVFGEAVRDGRERVLL
jgi:hypothetical protein